MKARILKGILVMFFLNSKLKAFRAIFLSLLLLIFAGGCDSGGSGSTSLASDGFSNSSGTNSSPDDPASETTSVPDLSTVSHEYVSGQLLLPADSAIDPSELMAYSTFGQQAVSSDGTFQLPISSKHPHLMAALDVNQNVRLLSIGLASTEAVNSQSTAGSSELSARSTALALALLSPGFATTDPEEAREVLQLLDTLPETDALELAVSNCLKQNVILAQSPEVATALTALINSASASLQPRNRVNPESRLSKAEIVLQVSDQGVPRYVVRNHGFRWIEVFTEGEQRSLGLVPGASLSWFNIGSGFKGIGELDITEFIMARDEDVTLEVWGPGLPVSDPFSDYVKHTGYPYLGTLLYNVAGPTIGVITGSGLKSDTAILSALANSLDLNSLVQSIVNSNSMDSGLKAATESLVNFLFSSNGLDILVQLFSDVSLEGFGFGSIPLVTVFDLLMASDSLQRAVSDISQANSKETFVITPFLPSLRFSTQPTDGQINTSFVPVVEVDLSDDNGFSLALQKLLANQEVTLSIESGPSGAILSGGTATTDDSGYAAFPNFSLDTPGQYRLKATVKVPGKEIALEALSTTFVVGGVPVAVDDDDYETEKNKTLVIEGDGIFENDTLNGADLSRFDSQSVQGGAVQVNSDGSFSYEPPRDFVGQDSFTYTLSGAGEESVGTVTIDIVEPLPPVANDDSYTTPADTQLAIAAEDSVFLNDTLREGFLSDYQTTSVQGGSVSLTSSAEGTFTYTPPAGFLIESQSVV